MALEAPRTARRAADSLWRYICRLAAQAALSACNDFLAVLARLTARNTARRQDWRPEQDSDW